MSVNKSVKGQLAKLMATENLVVEHCADQTASFDVVNRILRLPIWKTDVSSHVYDLMVGHEIAHALWTPSDKESLPSAAKEVCPDDPKLGHHYINVVEDARIERLVKQEYPGLRVSFAKGYKELMDLDFFDSKGRDLNSYLLIDRLNLYCKAGTLSGVLLNDEERAIVERLDRAETFQDVVAIAKSLFEYCEKEHELKQQEAEERAEEYEEDEDEQSEQDSRSDGEDYQDSSEGEGYNGHDTVSSSRTDDTGEGSGSAGTSGAGGNGNRDSNKPMSWTSSLPDSSDTPSMESQTQNAFDEQVKEKLTDVDTKKCVYVTVPDANLDRIVCGYKEVHETLRKCFLGKGRDAYQPEGLIEAGKIELAKFKKESEKTVAFLAKEFEMRKQADQYSRTSIAKSGVLDTNKIHTYKYNEDLFRRVAVIPGGKNHGLVMFMDMSGSMGGQMEGTIRQLLNLVMFCRRVQIPFDVYGFFEKHVHHMDDPTGKFQKLGQTPTANYKVNDLLIPASFRLRQYFSSKMKATEFQDAMVNMMVMSKYYSTRYGKSSWMVDNDSPQWLPQEENLGGTPIAETIMSAIKLVPLFKKKHKLQVVNTVFLTDGEGYYHLNYYAAPTNEEVQRFGRPYSVIEWERPFKAANQDEDTRFYLYDPITKKNHQIVASGPRGRTKDIDEVLFEILKDRSDAHVIGFYLTETAGRRYMQNIIHARCGLKDEQTIHNAWLKFKREKYIIGHHNGYDDYYILLGGKQMAEGTEDLNVDPEMTARQMTKQFMKHNKSKLKNRVVMSKFVDMIA